MGNSKSKTGGEAAATNIRGVKRSLARENNVRLPLGELVSTDDAARAAAPLIAPAKVLESTSTDAKGVRRRGVRRKVSEKNGRLSVGKAVIAEEKVVAVAKRKRSETAEEAAAVASWERAKRVCDPLHVACIRASFDDTVYGASADALGLAGAITKAVTFNMNAWTYRPPPGRRRGLGAVLEVLVVSALMLPLQLMYQLFAL